MRIIIPTDGSEFSEAAVETCCCLIISKPETTSVRVISVYPEVVPLDEFEASLKYAYEHQNAEKQAAERFVADAAATIRRCFPNSAIDVTTTIIGGATARELVQIATDWQADLIVVGSHGRGFWQRMLVGSTTDTLVHHAPCSVLVVRNAKTITS